ncbi:phosphate ABC transporter permease subunit PstC [Bdellovibrio bacteriovorus]|uniref:phosphate ABC transporter permease subunit PstC n=1 Tax=Bdellovibrio bacteriovorus TaxID=959 RepID=UPI0021D17B86|nr:phosphate ABC transporter permease subunit PstC [Bdellovibrio bacteriovorus]UXR63801.1 phosphate ABC transporter permease subunit PstC [Bdellovibrio bacteriovorus]
MRRLRERAIETVLFLAAASSVLVTIGIVGILVVESIPFFEHVTFKEFLTDTQWTPLFENAHYGILPLLSGTLLSTVIALSVAIPLGTVAAAFLSEYVRPSWREFLKPMLELLAAVPTVVYGYFALLFVTPLLQKIIPSLSGFNVLSAGIVIGVMIVPYVSSLSEDAMRSVPNHLREASFAVGASRMQTAFRVVIPAAFSGITSAYVLGISRALGETMVVAIAAGMQPNLTINPTEPAATITAFIVQVSLGDLPHGSIGYQSIYVAGLSLLVLTLCFNIVGLWLRKKFQEKE